MKFLYIILIILNLLLTIILAITQGADISMGGNFISCLINNLINYLFCYLFFNMLFEKFSKKHTIQVAIYSFLLSFVISYFFSFDFSNLQTLEIISLLIHLITIIMYIVNYNLDTKEKLLQKDIEEIEKVYNVKTKSITKKPK